jgi:hypothetical protein
LIIANSTFFLAGCRACWLLERALQRMLCRAYPPLAPDRVEAAKSVAMLDLALLKAEIECGLYKKPIEVLAKEIHYDPLAPDVRTVIIQSWRNFGVLPAAAIEQMVPEKTT